ncbi:hypothetical protein QP917_10330 [Corynebacterium pseudodiphtheriticum]|uniref:hypothetical protein n=1 Tax=Corynebacterium pseudodiphtheriticum TaxID=37637 RepID=UPI00254CE048|nr:hypothetical protein [Corynebacterium pseudodiphtheriticum]MDK8584816.1 hypothetical protein [Corynebacterium pseudodiphtheriticum]MDK8717917.1 hypothetical protein [Corynebacterium pseudodiphtheriticum]MDK8840537.1 hypothetical protein [Corynebacterium pseudodiphtheriticum]
MGNRTSPAVISAGQQAVLVVAYPACDHLYQQMWADSVEELGSEHVLHVCGTERVGQDVIDALRDAGPELLRVPRSARPRAFHARHARPLRRNPGRVTIPYAGGIAVVCGSPRANVPAPAIVLDRVRLDDYSELPATEFCGHRAGYI